MPDLRLLRLRFQTACKRRKPRAWPAPHTLRERQKAV